MPQGCQIFLGTTYKNGKILPYVCPLNIPNDCKIDQRALK
jgi:hypothetical protein